MKIAQTCQGDTLANLDQEGPNVKKQQEYVMQTQLHGTTFWRLDYVARCLSVRPSVCPSVRHVAVLYPDG